MTGVQTCALPIFFNLIRGTGVRGCIGMPERRGLFFRPLLSLPELPENIQKRVEDFESFLSKIFSFDQIIFELMRSGYINRNFYAYSSIFTKGFTNIKVFNFVINNLVTKQPNIHLRLTENEAKEITYHLKRIENRYCNLKGALNVDLMLYLTNDEWLLSSILDNTKHFFESESQSIEDRKSVV